MSLTSLVRPLQAQEFALLRLLAFARGVVVERDGLSVLGFGEAVSLPLPNGLGDPQATRDVAEILAAIGAGTIAIGAFHFLPDAGVALSVPAVCVYAVAGAEPVAVVVGTSPTEAAIDELLAAASVQDLHPGDAPPDSFRLESQRPHEDFL